MNPSFTTNRLSSNSPDVYISDCEFLSLANEADINSREKL